MTGRLGTVLGMIRFEHTVFALPFAFLGMVLAADGLPSAETIGWIVVAMVGARSAAMAFNRLVDRHLDATNPRTAGRALPAGELTPAFVVGFVILSVAVFVVACWRLNPLTLALCPIALTVVLGYSFTKRFTSLSHLVLGLGLGCAPLGAWIAVTGTLAPAPFLLTGIVLLWVAGFDVLYALQDLDHDRRHGLHSLPVRLGLRGALWASAGLHLAMVALLLVLPSLLPGRLGWGYAAGVAGCVLLLAYQHAVVRPDDLSRLDAAFFSANGFLAVWLLLATAVDVFFA